MTLAHSSIVAATACSAIAHISIQYHLVTLRPSVAIISLPSPRHSIPRPSHKKVLDHWEKLGLVEQQGAMCVSGQALPCVEI